MSYSLPFAPIAGLAGPAFIGLTVLLGIAFGFFLERAGFGSAKNLTSIFILRDFRVFRVMFSAVVTAMLGSQILRHAGLLDMSLVSFDPTYFWPMLTGGLLFGVGFYIGGFCPGTAVVALVRGRLDGLAFLLGIMLGIYGFALLFDAVGSSEWFNAFYSPADAARRTLYGSGPSWPWVAGLTAIAVIAFKVVPLVERRFALKTVEQLAAMRNDLPMPATPPPVTGGMLVRLGPVLAGAAALAVVVLEISAGGPASAGQSPIPSVVEVDAPAASSVQPETVAGWVVAEAHRRAAGEPLTSVVFDIRPPHGREGSIPGAEALDVDLSNEGGAVAGVLERLETTRSESVSGSPVVIIDRDGREGRGLVTRLRRLGVQAVLIDGGFDAWSREIVGPDASWAMVSVARPVVEHPQAPGGTTGTDTGETGEGAAEGSTVVAGRGGGPTAVDVAALRERLRGWLAGAIEGLPPRLALPGSIPPVLEAVTVEAQGGGGGGCG